MTPQEKAKEIYCKYADALNIRDLQTTANPFVKQCAIIAVEEIIEAILFDWFTTHNLEAEVDIETQHKYWIKVKGQILLL